MGPEIEVCSERRNGQKQVRSCDLCAILGHIPHPVAWLLRAFVESAALGVVFRSKYAYHLPWIHDLYCFTWSGQPIVAMAVSLTRLRPGPRRGRRVVLLGFGGK